MNDLESDAVNAAVNYEIECNNNSNNAQSFYVYQTLPDQPLNVFSLVWLVKRCYPGSRFSFNWGMDYSFVYGNTGILRPGVTFNESQLQPCGFTGHCSTFSVDNNTPHLSTPTAGGLTDSLTIYQASNVPNGVFSTGIGVSGSGTFVQQALANTTQLFTSNHNYWIGTAAGGKEKGQVLSQEVSFNDICIHFPPYKYTAIVTLTENGSWTIEYR